jgi:methionyl aminopeptidase
MYKKLKRNDLCWCNSGIKYKYCHLDIDEKLSSLKLKGYSVPNRELILNNIQIEGIKASGRLNTHLLDYVSNHICSGMTTSDIDELIYKETLGLGGIPATLNYNNYPKSVCTSVNDQVCHGIPSKDIILMDGDIVNVDVSTILNGYFSDSARVFGIGNVSEERQRLIDVSKKCVDIGLLSITPWQSMATIGTNISKFAEDNGFKVAIDIGGHGIGLKFHEEPFVSYAQHGTDLLLVPGMVFTIEPAINAGGSNIYEDIDNNWTIYTQDGKDSAQWEVTVLITEGGYEILAR